jgi:uncharacterized repeat protein (TIGR02543 family)
MKTKVLRGLFAIAISCVVAFGFAAQTNGVAFAADMPAAYEVSATEDPSVEPPEPEMVEAAEEDPPAEPPEPEEPDNAGEEYWALFDPNGGKIGSGYTTRVSQVYGETYTLPANPVRNGYTFKGWYTAKSGGSRITASSTVEITNTTRLYARWAGKKYTAMFDPNGGKIGTKYTVKVSQTYGGKYTLPANPARSGYTFKGWYTAKSGGSKISASSTVKITKTTRLYARWAGKKYWVVFDANGGKIGAENTQKTKQAYGGKYALPANPARDGYTFKGWYTAKSGGSKITASSTVKITKSTRLYAQWDMDMQSDADIVVETKINLAGSGTGWHGKLVIQDGNVAVSFGIQHDTHSGIGPQNQDYLMFESVRNSPAYHSYTGYGAVGPGWHTIRLEYSQAKNTARGYCDGEFIAEVTVQPIEANHIEVNKEAIPRMSGDTVDASFKDMFVYTTTFWYNGNSTFQDYGTFEINKSAEKSNYPRGNYLYYEQGEVWRLHGTANIPNGGDWDSYPTVGVRARFIFVKK